MDTATVQEIVTQLFSDTYEYLTNQDEINAVQAARIGLALRDLAEKMLSEMGTERIRSLDEVLAR